jgi:hypothetical protein
MCFWKAHCVDDPVCLDIQQLQGLLLREKNREASCQVNCTPALLKLQQKADITPIDKGMNKYMRQGLRAIYARILRPTLKSRP